MQITRTGVGGVVLGALGFLIALLLVAGMILPACADDDTPPLLPHGFSGLVKVGNQLAPEGVVVEAFVGGVWSNQTTVNAEGRYALGVGGVAGDAGKTVTFVVDGKQANETATWESGAVNQNFDLTVPGGGSFPLPLPFDCFIATAVYGTDTAEEIDVLREFRDSVLVPNRVGAAFVELYYEASPPLAEVIARHDFLRAVVRSGFIDPLVAVLNWSHDFWVEGKR